MARDVMAEARLLQTMARDVRRSVDHQEQAWRDAVLALVVPHQEDGAWREQMRARIARMQASLGNAAERLALLRAHADDAGQRLRGENDTPAVQF